LLPVEEEKLKKLRANALAQWEIAVHLSADQPDSSRESEIKRKWPLTPFWPDTEIVVTGEPGAGKTVLANALLSRIDPNATSLPGKSTTIEAYKFRQRTMRGRKKMKIQLSVIPGQAAYGRNRTEHTEFGRRATTASIHVVCWGRNRPWKYGDRLLQVETLRAHRGPDIDLENVFTEYKKNELNNFRRLSGVLLDGWRNQNSVWLIIAVTMCDLFKTQLDQEARDYFVPGSADLRAQSARTRAEDARQKAEKAGAAAAADPGAADLASDAARLRQEAVLAEKSAIEAARRATDDLHTGFARAIEELVTSVGPRRFKNLAILPVSAVHLDRNDFGVSGGETSLMNPTEIGQLLDHFVAKVGQFCAGVEGAA
jgi:hypothetical protein